MKTGLKETHSQFLHRHPPKGQARDSPKLSSLSQKANLGKPKAVIMAKVLLPAKWWSKPLTPINSWNPQSHVTYTPLAFLFTGEDSEASHNYGVQLEVYHQWTCGYYLREQYQDPKYNFSTQTPIFSLQGKAALCPVYWLIASLTTICKGQ